jgi:hypothetical protein
MKKKILKIAATFIACAGIIVFCTAASGTSTTSEAYIPSETITNMSAGANAAINGDSNEVSVEKHEAPIVLSPSPVVRVETRDKQELEALLATANAKLQAAQAMLESCTVLEYDEESPVVVLAKQEVANAQADIEYYQAILDEVIIALRNEERIAQYPVATKIWNFLKNDLGYSDAVAAGVMGNLMAEVGGQTLNIQPGLYGHGTNKGYYGICQWSKKYYPAVQGQDLDFQLYFLQQTVEGQFKTYGRLYQSGFTYADFCALEDEQAAALAFAKVYERCGSGSYNVRQRNATKALEYYTN